MTTEYVIQYSVTGRATCKNCRSKIAKKAIRVGVLKERYLNGNNVVSKLEKVPPSFTDFDEGIDDLTEEDQEKATDYVDDPNNQWTRGKSKKKNLIVSSNLTPKQMDDEKKLQNLVGFLCGNYTAKVLEGMLRENNQKISGVKNEKAYRCADGIMFGRLPLCPKCGGGKLRNEGSRKLSCPGYRDDEDFHFCRFNFDEYNPRISEDDENWVERGVWEYGNDEVEEEVKEYLESEESGGKSGGSQVMVPPPTPFSGEEADAEDESLDEDEVILISKRKKRKKRKKRRKLPKKKKYTDDEDEADEEEDDDDDGFIPPLEQLILDTPRRSTRLARKERKSYISTEEEVIYDTPITGKKRKRKSEDEEEYIPPVRQKRKL